MLKWNDSQFCFTHGENAAHSSLILALSDKNTVSTVANESHKYLKLPRRIVKWRSFRAFTNLMCRARACELDQLTRMANID